MISVRLTMPVFCCRLASKAKSWSVKRTVVWFGMCRLYVVQPAPCCKGNGRSAAGRLGRLGNAWNLLSAQRARDVTTSRYAPGTLEGRTILNRPPWLKVGTRA